jgi:serine/threonine protein kinase/Tol biopolymer transport system component
MIGETLSHYRVTSKLGAGGMGEVFRATDSRLHRDVALKLLPEHLANDKDRMARFHREAQVLASLSHPHIAGIHGLEESGGRSALVMELVEGEDLADRLSRGPIPLVEALHIAQQIADALEAAHEKGIIHRDLKPANVKITPDGQVKVLDFGLAKALEGSAGGGALAEAGASATLSVAATRAGIVMGTVAYMSPEQASGSLVDKRSDIWAYGVVLFEMLAGRRLFEGETTSHTMADVLRADIDWNRLPASTPVPIRRLLERCLERDRKRRLQAIAEARIIIDDYLANASPSGSRSVALPAIQTRPSSARLPWIVAAVSVVALLGALALLWQQWGARRGSFALRADVKVSDAPLFTDVGSSIELSPDATRLVYVAGSTQIQQLYIRALNQLDGTKLAEGNTGSSSPYQPFFSPDGQWLGYVTAGEMRKVPVSGGTPLTLCKVTRSRGASWAPDDTIIFAPTPSSGLFRVSAAGGEPQPLTTLDKARKEVTHRWPQVLPGGKAVIFTSHTQATADFDNATIEVLTLATGQRKVLQKGGSYGRYVPSGHLVYVSKAALFAVPFDLSRLEVTGSPAPVVQDVFWNPTEGAAQFTFSSTGVLTYLRGGPEVAKYPIVVVDRKGGTSKLIEEGGAYANPRLSPDGKQLALTVLKDGNFDVWVYDLERGVPTRLTFDDAPDTEQVWSPDGRYLVFSSGRDGADNLYRKRADGSGDEERLTKSDIPMWANSWSRDGRSIVFAGMGPNGNFDVSMLTLEDKKVQPLLASNFREADPNISPDGRWLAYTSSESGRLEVYVRPFPAGAGRWQVSDTGGGFPRWAGNGRELFYRVDDGIMSASIEAVGDSIRTGKPTRLFTGAFRGGVTGISIGGNTFADYDVSADGQRFVMFPSTDAESTNRGVVTLVTEWFDELTRTFAKGR